MAKALIAITGVSVQGINTVVGYVVSTDAGKSWGGSYKYNWAQTRVENRTAFRTQVLNQAADKGVTLTVGDVEVFGD